ncbi:MAG: gliding motility-associated C-terminal domain-containing protein [Bacteroidales bacterium]|nr:gliding motility-associated C-terminal domain-containing protein [Bacteroidales bacterium]MCF8390414.1 gliding motility-associated C-terminal domain-containing protein [Bacteroidales bacterium]
MKKVWLQVFWFKILIIFSFAINAQTLPEFWLGNGFSSGQTIITNSGLFLDDGGYGLYHAGQNWNVRFCSQNGNPITVDFTGFKTDYRGTFPPPYGSTEYLSYDYLRARTYTSDDVVAYNDDTPQFSFTAPDGCIRFDFVSNIASLLDSGWVAEISAIPPPVNNDPCTASPVPVGNVCSPVFYSNKGAYNTTNLGSPACHEYLGGDVWFRTVVPQTGNLKIETVAGSLNYAIMALYTGSCATLTPLAVLPCVDNPGTMPYAILSGRTPGETIYVRIFGDQAKSGTFGICATDPSTEISGYKGPGGVGDSISNVLWLKADHGVLDNSDAVAGNAIAVKSWLDASGNNNNLLQSIPGSQPVFFNSAINTRPALKFDGFDDKFLVQLGALSAPLTFFAINDFNSSNEQTVLCLGDVNNDNTLSISRETDNRYFTFSESSKYYGPILPSSANLLSVFHQLISPPYHNVSLNGTIETVSDYPSPIVTDGSLHLGSSFPANNFFDGNLSEVILYTKKLNLAQEIIVNNYLSAKYSIALSSNDKYNYEVNHPWDVAGIGRENNLNMHTKAMSAGIISIGGADDLEDGEYLLFGHDNADAATWVSTETPNADINLVRIAREWRVCITGGIGDGTGSVNISIDPAALPILTAGFISYNVLVDSDGDFSSGAVDYGLINSGTEFVANNVSLNDGDFLTITAVQPSISFTITESEGLESVVHPIIEVNLNYALSENSSVEYRISSGTATGGGVDYNLNQDQLNFAAGIKTMEIVPLIIDDESVEIPDENFVIELFNPSAGISLGSNVFHTYTINDNDLEISVAASDTIIGECSESFSILTANALGQAPFSFSWAPTDGLSSPNNPTTNANPSSTTTYVVSVSDALGNISQDSVTIEVVASPTKPVITNSGVLEFCTGDSVILSTTPMDSYLWSNGSNLQNLSVFASGNFTVIVEDVFGCPSEESDTTKVIVNSLPIVTVTDPASVCSPATVDLTDVAITSGSDAGLTFSYWTDASATVLYGTPGVATNGSYYIKGSNPLTGCETISPAVTVTVNPLPAVAVTDPAEVCSPATVDLTEAAITAGSDAGLTFSYWTDALATLSYSTPSAATDGSYYIKGTNPLTGCETISSVVTVTVNPLPAVVVTDPAGVCSPATVDLTEAAITAGSDAGLSFSYWTDALATLSYSTPSAATDGSYYIKGTNPLTGCETISSAVTVTVNPLPAVVVTDPAGVCSPSTVDLTEAAITAGSDAGLTYSYWTDALATSSYSTPSAATDGSYYIKGTNPLTGCETISTVVTVTVNPLPAVVVNDPAGVCSPATVDLTSAAITAGSDAGLAFSYWTDALATSAYSTPSAATDGSYYIKGTNSLTGCETISPALTASVNPVPEKPIIDPAGPHYLITGDSILLSAVGVGDAYLWSNGAITPSVYIKESGNYTITLSNVFNCYSLPSDEVQVTVSDFLQAPVITANGATQFCEGESVELSTVSAAEYLWSNGESTQSIIVSDAGSYTVVITDALGRKSLPSDPAEITVFMNPTAGYTTEDVSCFGFGDGSINVDITSGALPVSVQWDGGESGTELNMLSAGTYMGTIKDNNDCETPISVIISEPDQMVANAILNLPYCPDANDGNISMEISGGTPPYLFSWESGEMGAVLYNLAPGDYSVSVSDLNNCVEEFPISLDYENTVCFMIPDIITPNNDGKNDDWVIDGLNYYPDCSVEIYDRWGKRVFYSKGYENNWNGNFEGKELPMESYHYIIDLKNGSPVIIGNITIVR